MNRNREIQIFVATINRRLKGTNLCGRNAARIKCVVVTSKNGLR